MICCSIFIVIRFHDIYQRVNMSLEQDGRGGAEFCPCQAHFLVAIGGAADCACGGGGMIQTLLCIIEDAA